MYKLLSNKSKQISCEIVADSISNVDNSFRMTTFELTMPRFIWAECLTHRMFSRNAASSRAIPIIKKIKQVWNDPALPVHWGKNKSGMQAKEELNGFRLQAAKFGWWSASKLACSFAYFLHLCGLHKQVANRILEPFEIIKVVVSATNFENWFWLRDHEDAQPEIREVASLMRKMYNRNKDFATKLNPGEWHLPYIERYRDKNEKMHYRRGSKEYSIETAQKISASLCAQVSYRLLNDDERKAVSIFNRLIESKPVHASPTEHQATPMVNPIPVKESSYAEPGMTHYNVIRHTAWSGNLEGWIQFRQLIPNNVRL